MEVTKRWLRRRGPKRALIGAMVTSTLAVSAGCAAGPMSTHSARRHYEACREAFYDIPTRCEAERTELERQESRALNAQIDYLQRQRLDAQMSDMMDSPDWMDANRHRY